MHSKLSYSENSIFIQFPSFPQISTHFLFFPLFAIFLINLSCLYAQEEKEKTETPCVQPITLSLDDAESYPDLETRSFVQLIDPGHSKTVLTLYNVPINEKIICYQKRLMQKDRRYNKYQGFDLNEQKKMAATDEDSQTKSMNLCVSSRGYLPGERLSFVFKIKNRDSKIKTSFIPNPIQATNESKTVRIEAELIQLIPAFYIFSFSGFQEGEEIEFFSHSGHEKIRQSIKISKGFNLLTSPDIIGKEEGVGKVTFTRKSGEKICVNLPWGLELFKYNKGDKIYKAN